MSQIAQALGSSTHARDPATLSNWIAGRLRELALPGIEPIAVLLTEDNAIARRERELLTEPLSTGESYFFRAQGQFNPLAEELPSCLIVRRASKGRLRIWTAGAPLMRVANE